MPKCILSGQKPKLTAADVDAVPTSRTINIYCPVCAEVGIN